MSNKDKKIFYKVGVLSCGTVLHSIKFACFEEMAAWITKTKNKHGWDMGYCTFVVQAYKDDSYDFTTSCFLQEEFGVNAWNEAKKNWLKAEIKKQYSEDEDGRK